LDDKRISAKASALGGAFQLLAQIWPEADTGGGGGHVIFCGTHRGMSREGIFMGRRGIKGLRG